MMSKDCATKTCTLSACVLLCLKLFILGLSKAEEWIHLKSKSMFPPGVRSDVSRSINNESSLKLHLNSFLINLLTSLLTLGGNIP
jgi:hypothetical protein